MRILTKQSFIVKRKVSEDGHYNDDGEFVSASEEISIPIKGNCQPYIKGSVMNGTQLVLPDGIRLTDTRILYSKAELRTTDDVLKTEADVVMVKDVEYEVFMVMDWSEQLKRTSHYEYIIIRRDKMNAIKHS